MLQQALPAQSYRDLYRSASVRKERLYSPTQAAVGAFLGGPLAAVVYLHSNFTALGEQSSAARTRLLGGLVMLALLCVLPLLPDAWPRMAIPLATVIATRLLVEKHHLTKQAIAESDEFAFHSGWRVLAVAFVSLLIFLAVFVGVVLALSL